MCSSDELRSRLRAHQRPARISRCVKKLTEILNIDDRNIGFLPLAETAELKAVIHGRLKSCSPFLELLTGNRSGLDEAVSRLAGRMAEHGPEIVLLHVEDDDVGAAVLPADRVLEAVWDLKDAGFVSDVTVSTRRGDRGFSLDFGWYTSDGTYYPEGVCEIYEW